MGKRENFLVYDATCAFCTGLAGYFQSKWKVKIVPNNVPVNYIDKKTIKRDVHYVVFNENGYVVYHGAEAAIMMAGKEYPILVLLYSIIGIRQVIQAFYWIVKKSRKYLRNLF